MTANDPLLVERVGSVDWVTLNRPETLNALNRDLVEALLEYFGRLYFDKDVRVVVLRGAGRAFCAGADLKQGVNADDPMPDPVQTALRGQRKVSEIVLRMRRCPQPILGLIGGAAAGGGLSIAAACDIRIASRTARFNAAFIRIGLSGCDVGISYLLPRLVGASVASEMLMTGRFVDAERALQVGLVSQVVADGELEQAAVPMLEDLLRTSPIGLRLTKECLNMSIDAPSLESAIAMEDRTQILTVAAGAVAEGAEAFLQKRIPEWAEEVRLPKARGESS